MTVGELMKRMSSLELSYWMAYYSEIEPFGDVRDDLRMGMICSSVLAPHMKKGSKPPTPEDFLLFQKKKKKQEGLTGKQGALVASRMFPRGK